MMDVKWRSGEVRVVDDENRRVQFVISTGTRDRHRTVLNPQNWNLDNFNRNPVVGYQHNVYGDMCREPNPDDVLGPSSAWVEGEKLIGEVDFETKDLNPLADKIYRKIKNGTLRATSVGFIEVGKGEYGEDTEARGGDNETYHFAGQELLEFSIVNIPSNPDALARSMDIQTERALQYIHKKLDGKLNMDEIKKLQLGEVISLVSGEKELPDVVEMSSTGDTFTTNTVSGTNSFTIIEETDKVPETQGNKYINKIYENKLNGLRK